MSIIQTQTTSFKAELYQAVHNLLTDTIKIALYTGNASLGYATTVYSSTNEVSGTGYTAGGVVMTRRSFGEDSGLGQLLAFEPPFASHLRESAQQRHEVRVRPARWKRARQTLDDALSFLQPPLHFAVRLRFLPTRYFPGDQQRALDVLLFEVPD